MVTAVTAIVVAVALGLCDRRARRHPAWDFSPRGRFYVSIGYPMVAIAAYFLMESSSGAPWALALCLGWALAASTVFVLGFTALRDVVRRHHTVSQSIETIADPVAAAARRR
ncbi:MAG: hypothetical protein ABWY45_07840 [Mycobacterium sp.]